MDAFFEVAMVPFESFSAIATIPIFKWFAMLTFRAANESAMPVTNMQDLIRAKWARKSGMALARFAYIIEFTVSTSTVSIVLRNVCNHISSEICHRIVVINGPFGFNSPYFL